MVAAAHDNAVLAGVLIQSGADIGAKTAAGKTALDIAKANRHASAAQQIELLMRAAAKNGAGDGKSAPPAPEPAAGQ
jgi:ankyrin repeat protein